MEKLRIIPAILLCITLFQSSCDLLTDTEAEVMDYVLVSPNIYIKVQAWRREFDQEFLGPAPLAVQVKLYCEDAKSNTQEVLLNREITMEEMKTGYFDLTIEPSYIREGEVFTASAYLVDFPSVYITETLSYSDAKKIRIITLLGEEYGSVWSIYFNLVVPKQ